MNKHCYQTPLLQLLPAPEDVLRTSEQKPTPNVVESGFGDEMDF